MTAIAVVASCLVSFASEAEDKYDKGLKALAAEEFDSAIVLFTEVLRLDPKSARAFNGRGIAYWNKNDNDRAVSDLSEAIRLDPKFADAFRLRGTIYIDKKDYDRAISDFSEAIRLDPMDAKAYVGRGEALSEKKKYDQAISDYSEAIRLDPKYSDAYAGRGNVLSSKKEFGRAISDYAEAIRLDPKNALAYNTHAWIEATCVDAKMRNGKRAVEYATKACELSKWEDSEPIDTLAAAYAEAGDFVQAVKWQKKSIELEQKAADKQKLDDYRKRLRLYEQGKPFRDE